MKTILFAADFSDASKDALVWAKMLAKQYGANIVALHVQAIPVPDASMPVIGDLGLGTVAADTAAVHHEQLNELADTLQTEGVSCRTDLRRGAINDTILAAADEHKADLIVMGRSQMSGFFDRLMGTSATGVARFAHCPVLVVPTSEDDVTPSADLKTIVYSSPLEFDEEVVFGQVVALARVFGASLRVLHVQAENQPNLTDDAEIISQLQAVYGPEPLPVDTVKSNTVTGGIEKYLDKHPADLLVMTTRERDFLSGLLNPSLTGRMVVLSHIPLLVYQAKGDL
ncbi:universal stress protein [Spirosoma montaniterrae]|uniref:UspA domain-containing protein n=1 Tax=Spirosoma montaniterrae TaxID=1178516 RepID=A0A1P9WWD5_9BACT|nr:universal stress protein [Spirosoma montaniterrae]AQG79686.1 hypothetical protein AWR27_10310 [Spirosoma montaniterrae]